MNILKTITYVFLFCLGYQLWAADNSLPKQVAKFSLSASFDHLRSTSPIPIKMDDKKKMVVQSCINFGGHPFRFPAKKQESTQKIEKFEARLKASQDALPKKDSDDLIFDFFDMGLEADDEERS